jgi:hypothetical protein
MEAFKYSAENEKDVSEMESLYDFIKSKAREDFGEEKGDFELLLQMSKMWGAYIGDSVERQSLKFSWMEECCGGGKIYILLFKTIAKKILQMTRCSLKPLGRQYLLR